MPEIGNNYCDLAHSKQYKCCRGTVCCALFDKFSYDSELSQIANAIPDSELIQALHAIVRAMKICFNDKLKRIRVLRLMKYIMCRIMGL
ncbi:MAG: hypothetical protein JW841_07205 [Deltaproteobacteria bacterium]|nr:hypothetical protein [Deltaproteobacteria bacterium]